MTVKTDQVEVTDPRRSQRFCAILRNRHVAAEMAQELGERAGARPRQQRGRRADAGNGSGRIDAGRDPAGSGYTVDAGAPVDLSGNELENSPNWTAGFGAQYTHELKTGYTLQARVDYYWQSGSWAKIFNHQNLDRLESWQRVNAQVTLNSPDERWYARAWVKNLTNEDVIVGTDSTDPTAGIFTNVFLLEPRQVGLTLGAKF